MKKSEIAIVVGLVLTILLGAGVSIAEALGWLTPETAAMVEQATERGIDRAVERAGEDSGGE